MKRLILLSVCLLFSLVAAETFEPNRMQFGCPSIDKYERGDNAKGYGAAKIFSESGCIYLKGMDLVYAQSEKGYIKVCLKDNEKMCYWTIDSRH